MQAFPRRSALALAAVLSSSVPTAWAQVSLPLRLDLQPTTDPGAVPAGYTAVLPSTVYAAGGYGWLVAKNGLSTSIPSIPVEVMTPLGAAPAELAEVTDRANLVRDGHFIRGVGSNGTFQVDVGTSVAECWVSVAIGRVDPPFVSDHRGALLHAATPPTAGNLVTREIDPVDFVTQGLWTRTISGKANLNSQQSAASHFAGYRKLWFSATPVNGVVSLYFDNPLGGYMLIDSIEVYERTEAPIVFDEVTPTLAVNPAYASGMAPADATRLGNGVSALLAHQYAAAETAFDAIAGDDFAKATGLLWIAGWPSEEELGDLDGRDWRLLQDAIALLEPLSGPAGLRDQYLEHARDFRRAFRHQKLRGYTGGIVFPGETTPTDHPYTKDALVKNLNISEALWRNVASQQAAAVVGNPTMEVHPLYFRGLLYLAQNWWGRTAQNKWATTDPGGPPTPPYSNVYLWNNQWYDLWKEFDAAGWITSLFGDSSEMRIGDHVATYDGPDAGTDEDYDEDVWGGLLFKWQGEGSATVHGAASKWWDPLLGEANQVTPTGSTDWAGHQWRGRQALIAGHEWWIDNRYLGGEYGGGGGDDVEFLLLQYYPTFPIRGNEEGIEDVAREVVDSSLEAWGEDGTGTFFFINDDPAKPAADVEHTAEYTGNPLWVGMQLLYGEPYYLEYAMQSMQLFEAAASPWTESVPLAGGHTYPDSNGTPQPIPSRKFIAWHLDGDGPDTGGGAWAGDLSLNGRAVIGSYLLNAYNGNTESSRLMREWAEWWWIVAMDDGTLTSGTPEQQKPAGVLPSVVEFDSGSGQLQYGNQAPATPKWWQGGYDNKPDAKLNATLVYSYFIYSGLFLERYVDPDTPAAERSDYLLPIYESARLAAESWRLSGQGSHTSAPVITLTGSPTQVGSSHWTADRLKNHGNYLLQVAQALPYMEADAVLQARPEHADVMIYLGELLIAKGDPYTETLVTGGKQLLTDVLAGLYDWLDTFFAMGTNLVAFSDRAFLTPKGPSLFSTFTSSTGGFPGAFPGYAVTWERPVDGFGGYVDEKLEISVFVKGVEEVTVPGIGTTDRLTALVHNYEQQPPGAGPDRDLVARFWYALEPGQYVLAYGPNNGSDAITPGTEQYVSPTFDILRPGRAVTFPLPYAPTSAGTELVVEVTRQASLPVDKSFTDLAVSERDVEIDYSGGVLSIDVTFHNVGNTRVMNVPYEVWAQVTGGPPTLLPPPIPDIDLLAPNDLVPKRVTVSWQFTIALGTGTVVDVGAFVDPGGTPDDNPSNDVATGTYVVP